MLNSCTLLDFTTLTVSFISFIIITTISLVFHQRSSRELGLESESTALLEETNEGTHIGTERTQHDQATESTRTFKLFLIKSFACCILLTFAIDVILELYYDLKRPVIPSEILDGSCRQDWYFRVSRLSANVFCWTICSFCLFFQDQQMSLRKWLENHSRRYLEKWFILGLLTETARTIYWTIILFFNQHPAPFWSLKVDVALYGLMLSRIILLVLLVSFSIENRKSLTLLLNSGTMELSPLRKTFARIKQLIPFLWPNELRLQLLVLTCLFLLALGRVVNVLVPVTYKYLVEELADTSTKDPIDRTFAWIPIISFTFFRFMQGGVGVLSSLQYFLWIPVGQYTTRQISVKILAHLHSLPLSFHLHSKTGELLRVIDRGTASVGSLLSYLLFNILPVLIDIVLAVIYFSLAFDSLVSFIVCVTMICYIIVTISITEWRTKFRKDMNDLDAAARARAVDSLLNYETVKYFGREKWEVKQYEEAIKKYQVSDFKSSASLNLLNTAQNCVITAGLFLGLLVCGKRVVQGDWSVGDFVGFITYLLQLYQPLNWFGTYYRVIQQNFVDMEKMMQVFEQESDIAILVENESTSFSSQTLQRSRGIVFDQVSFTYNQVPVLQGISFEIPAGKNFALVGTSGGGKSSILKLLFRFYSLDQGRILLDGVDISTIPLPQLRKKIGVVPQDCILFNDTIRNNIAYGADSEEPENVSKEQIEVVAKQAQIHDRIMTFPQGYETLVGERGVRLSGGEKQRVALARTLLKNPDIILLDEATSSLDASTEALLSQTMDQILMGRTRLTVAHRLSTIVDCDCILVVNEGKIVEKGKHDELIRLGGIYYRMWTRQIHEEKKKFSAGSGTLVSEGTLNATAPIRPSGSLLSRHH